MPENTSIIQSTKTLGGAAKRGMFSVHASTIVGLRWHPCAQITAACTRAGFVPNGAKLGAGIMVDCIRPIIAGSPQRKQATKALPQIDPQIVAACNKRDPDFGKDRRAKM
jgi:predicted phage tail protein